VRRLLVYTRTLRSHGVWAEPLFQGALRIRKKALGPEHPDTTNSLNSLASLYLDMGE